MRADPGIVARAGALAIIAMLAGCAPAAQTDAVLTPAVADDHGLDALSQIEVLADIPYGTDPLQRLDVCLPPASGQTSLAAMLVVHGGSWARGDKADPAWRSVCQWLAAEGYLAVSVNYRLAPADVFPAAFDDVRSVVAWLRAPEQAQRFLIDPERIGALGGSAGGNLVALLGTSGSGDLGSGSRVAAVVEISGPIDLTGLAVRDEFVPVQLAYLGCAVPQGCAKAAEASATYAIDATDPPFFIAHSTDEMIPIGQAELLVAGLRAAAVPVDYARVEGTQHSLAMLDAELKARIAAFLAEHLAEPTTLGAG
ncbi:MAG: alpha/beta hydrolase [Microbacteriaceae bacterium]|nr:alpha/beta hydrolase [Microbacteriaceae bacterium]